MTTQQRIGEIIKEFATSEIDTKLLEAMLGGLVMQTKAEQVELILNTLVPQVQLEQLKK